MLRTQKLRLFFIGFSKKSSAIFRAPFTSSREIGFTRFSLFSSELKIVIKIDIKQNLVKDLVVT